MNYPPLRKVLMRKDANLIGIGITHDGNGLWFITIAMIKAKNPARTLPTTASDCGWAQTNLRVRSRGPAVRVAQCAMQAKDAWTGPIDGVFNSAFAQAVKAYQRSVGLKASGVLDIKTRRSLGIS